MPLFEYQCQACGKTTEFLEPANTRASHACEHCGGKKMTKLLSGFAVGRGGCSDSKPCTGCSNFECPHTQ